MDAKQETMEIKISLTPKPKTGISCPESNGYFESILKGFILEIVKRRRESETRGDRNVRIFATLDVAFSIITLLLPSDENDVRCNSILRLMSES